MKKIKLISLILALVMVIGLFAACGSEKPADDTTAAKTPDEGNTTVDNTQYEYGTVHGITWTYGGTADKSDTSAVEREKERNALYKMETGNTRDCVAFSYNFDTIGALFEGGGLPTLFSVVATEPARLVSAGWGRDISNCIEAVGLDLSDFNQGVLETYKDENGGVYGLPIDAYSMCLVVNGKVYKEAGVVDENGEPIAPKTWDELIEQALTIKEKTGAGLALQCSDNQGGWIFSNIAWNFGADLCVLNEETGKYESGIYSEATIAALEWWKKAINSGAVINPPSTENRNGCRNMLKAGRAAVLIEGSAGCANQMTDSTKDGMPASDIYYFNMPAGPDGLSYNLMGGTGWWFGSDATDEQVIAALEYLMHYGYWQQEWTEVAQKADIESWKLTREKNAVQEPAFPVYNAPYAEERNAKRQEIAGGNGELYNFDAQFGDIFNNDSINFHAEEECDCQNLYAQLTAILQEISVNPDADCDALAKTAHDNYNSLLEVAQAD